jgi:CubicO group peptidase (beta-lactamase class C family)
MTPLERAMAELTPGTVPSISAAVAREGAERWVASTGLAELESRRPASPATAYCWFSMTKMVTATAVMQLAERGRLGLDDPVSRYVDGLPGGRGHAPVTVRHLLSHSAGLANPLPVRWIHPAEEAGPQPSQLLARLLRRQRRLKGEPGDRARYSNVGFLVLGEVIAAASGRPYRAYVREQILQPVGMTRTDFGYTPAVAQDAATGYHRRRSLQAAAMELVLPRWVLGPRVAQYRELRRFVLDGSPYGGLVGPAEDAARFVAAHVGHGTTAGTRLLSPESVDAMQTHHARGRALDVGLGWVRRHSDAQTGERYWEHLGGGAGFRTMMRVYPERALGLVTMGNATTYDHRRLAAAVLEA